MIGHVFKTDYSDADRRVAAAMGAMADAWVNVYLIDGVLVYSVMIHESQPLAALFFQIDAEEAGIDLDRDGVLWVGAVEYTEQEGATK